MLPQSGLYDLGNIIIVIDIKQWLSMYYYSDILMRIVIDTCLIFLDLSSEGKQSVSFLVDRRIFTEPGGSWGEGVLGPVLFRSLFC